MRLTARWLFATRPRPFVHFSPCGRYRYDIGVRWDDRPLLVVCGINPSTAGLTADGTEVDHDNTTRRVEGFAHDIGYGGWAIINPFAYCNKDVRVLAGVVDPVGPDNDSWLRLWATWEPEIVCGWGPPTKVPIGLRDRFDTVVALFLDAGARILTLRPTKEGHCSHPLMLPASCRPVPWAPPGSRS